MLSLMSCSYHVRLEVLLPATLICLCTDRFRLSLCKLRVIRDLLDEPGMQTLSHWLHFDLRVYGLVGF